MASVCTTDGPVSGPSGEWLVWLRDRLCAPGRYSEDLAQDVVVALLQGELKGGEAEWLRYAEYVAKRLDWEQKNPIHERAPDGTWLRRKATMEEVRAGAEALAQQGENPETVVLAKEHLLLLLTQDPEWVRQCIFGGPRMASCHRTRPHYAHGQCKSCYEGQRRRYARA